MLAPYWLTHYVTKCWIAISSLTQSVQGDLNGPPGWSLWIFLLIDKVLSKYTPKRINFTNIKKIFDGFPKVSRLNSILQGKTFLIAPFITQFKRKIPLIPIFKMLVFQIVEISSIFKIFINNEYRTDQPDLTLSCF